MKANMGLVRTLVLALTLVGVTAAVAGTAQAAPSRPKGPCDIYTAAGDPCAAAHSTTRALYAAYNGPLYQVTRQSDGKKLNIGVVQPSGNDAGGYANAPAQDVFCANTTCWISTVYDQSPKHNDLTQAPRGAFSGPALGGFNNLPIADMAPITVMGHKAYGIFIIPGMGIRNNDTKGTAVDDQGEGQYWVINGQHFNNGCCFDYGNAEIDSRDDDNGTMETLYFGNSTGWYYGHQPGPWVMTDQENNLVGCVNPGSTSKLCTNLPNVTSRFVTGIAKGEPHHWSSMGGDAQKGPLNVVYAGQRVDGTYDPMRKQGAILLGNGGDNSNSSQGTFYEGAMTAAGTYPNDATDQAVQANIVAAGYNVAPLSIAAAAAMNTPNGIQTFAPGTSQETSVTFTNTTGMAVSGLKLALALPKGWTSSETGKAFAGPIAPGASVTATFRVTSGTAAFNGDLVASATYAGHTEKAAEKARNANPVTINEFRVGDAANASNSFIELYNGGSSAVDISNWTLTQHQTQQAIFSNAKIPAGTKLASRGFYVLGLASSGLVTGAKAGDSTIAVRSVTGISAGDSVTIGSGADAETRKVATVGTAAEMPTNLWQPQPDGLITIPAGSTNVPVFSTAGFEVGQKIALGYGTTYPAVSRNIEHYEVATVTAVGKPGTQAFLGADVAPGDTNLKVTNLTNITAGDKIRLDIDSMGHGIETVTVKSVGTAAIRTNLTADVKAGATSAPVRSTNGLMVGHKLNLGTPANRQVVTVTSVSAPPAARGGRRGGGAPGLGGAPASVSFTPALAADHVSGEHVVDPGTGLELTAPMKFAHTANLPFAARGTGISFSPATKFVHLSNEPVQALGTGITLDKPLAKAHAIDAVVQDANAKSAGFQGKANQMFGGPALSNGAGSMVLRDAAGLVVDSLNYGLVVDPWAAQGYQAISGTGLGGCRAAAPGHLAGRPPVFSAIATNSSSGRFPDGANSNSNCNDFLTQGNTALPEGAAVGATNIKVTNVTDFAPGQTITIGSGADEESATIANVGTAGGTHLVAAAAVGAMDLEVTGAAGFAAGETITVGGETVAVAASRGTRLALDKPLTQAHAEGSPVAGSGITLTAGLKKAHAADAPVGSDLPTPGAPNKYTRAR